MSDDLYAENPSDEAIFAAIENGLHNGNGMTAANYGYELLKRRYLERGVALAAAIEQTQMAMDHPVVQIGHPVTRVINAGEEQ